MNTGYRGEKMRQARSFARVNGFYHKQNAKEKITMKKLHVVGAAIVKEGKVLAAKRL